MRVIGLEPQIVHTSFTIADWLRPDFPIFLWLHAPLSEMDTEEGSLTGSVAEVVSFIDIGCSWLAVVAVCVCV